MAKPFTQPLSSVSIKKVCNCKMRLFILLEIKKIFLASSDECAKFSLFSSETSNEFCVSYGELKNYL